MYHYWNMKGLFLLSLLSGVVLKVGNCDEDDEEYCDMDQSDYGEADQSFCQFVLKNDKQDLYDQDDNNVLTALATSILNLTFPSQLDNIKSFASFDELPYPVPTGASSYFMVLFTVIFTWYFGKFLHWLFRVEAKKLDLFPVTDHFPNLKLYMIQQTKRESQLKRDVRNSWAWLATFYLLRPSDDNVNSDEIFRTTEWTDFEVPHDVWGIIREVLRVSVMDNEEEPEVEEEEDVPIAKAASDTQLGVADKEGENVAEHRSVIEMTDETREKLERLRGKVDADYKERTAAANAATFELRPSENTEHLNKK